MTTKRERERERVKRKLMKDEEAIKGRNEDKEI